MNSSSGDKRLAIVQSNYIPWKGYFDLIRSVDEFVFLDDAQFTRRDWRNRNRIKTPQGTIWLTIPVISKGRYDQSIDATEIAAPWKDKHWTALRHCYAHAAHFSAFAPAVKALLDSVAEERLLSTVNQRLIAGICGLLGISTVLRSSRTYDSGGARTDRLIAICRAAGATHYLSGPSARAYIEPEKFAASDITLSYADYSGYPPYPQLHGAFDHAVSILDLMFNTGRDAPSYMRLLA
jgi:hypothetical protein